MKTTNEILREAAEYIGKHGWNQGSIMNRDGHVCAIGAIQGSLGILTGDMVKDMSPQELADRSHAGDDAKTKLWRFIRSGKLPLGDGAPCTGIGGWNDTTGRTAEDVILTLKLAAEEL